MTTVVLNARFRMRQATGVDVHAQEVAARLRGLVEVGPSTLARGIGGHAWEQSALPIRARTRPIWSPCNTGPVVSLGRHVLTLHDVAPFDQPHSFSFRYRAMARSAMWAAARRASAIATVSNFSADRIVARLGISTDRVCVVGNGVSDVRKSGEPSPPDDPYLLTIGSMDPRKRLGELIDAHARSGIDMPLRVVGGLNDRVFAGTRHIGGAQVEMLGYVTDDELKRQLSGASAFISYSGYEGFGMPPADAAASAIPTIVSDIATHREVLGGVGGVHFAGDADDLIDLIRLASTSTMERADADEVARRHSWATTADRYVGLFNDVFGEPEIRLDSPGAARPGMSDATDATRG